MSLSDVMMVEKTLKLFTRTPLTLNKKLCPLQSFVAICQSQENAQKIILIVNKRFIGYFLEIIIIIIF